MKIFIVGCAKTGTTLLQRLFFAFRDIHIILGEVSIDTFLRVEKRKTNFLAKRVLNTVFSNELSRVEIDRQLKLIKENDVKLICTIREREATLRSDNGWVIPFRYDACTEQLEKYRSYVKMVVDYDDLVTEPNNIQKLIERQFGLKSIHKFSDYPDFVPREAFGITAHNDRYKARKIGEKV